MLFKECSSDFFYLALFKLMRENTLIDKASGFIKYFFNKLDYLN